MGLDAFKWTFAVVFIIAFAFNLYRGESIVGSAIAAAFIGAISGGMVSMGKDKLDEP